MPRFTHPASFLAELEECDLLDSVGAFNRWLERGDGVAVYRNQDLGHPDLGHCKVVSFGGSQALLEHTDEPPVRLPDIGNQINWRYQLVAWYRGEPLPVPEEADSHG